MYSYCPHKIIPKYMSQFSEKLFQAVPIVGILRGYPKATTLNIVDAYYQAGFTTIEITMNTPQVAEIISAITAKYNGKLNVGAGTVCNEAELDIALAAGAQFIVSPIVDISLIKKCKSLGIPVFPGAFTPTEIYQAWTAGARMVKLFPANTLGPKYVKNVLAPLNDIEIMPTGGVSLENIEAYKKMGAKAFGMGGLLFDKGLIAAEDWDGLKKKLTVVKAAII